MKTAKAGGNNENALTTYFVGLAQKWIGVCSDCSTWLLAGNSVSCHCNAFECLAMLWASVANFSSGHDAPLGAILTFLFAVGC
jgi:hypothetical protein